MIQSTVNGGPSQAAGILPNDILISINGTPLLGIGIEEVVKMLRGPEGTEVRLELQRLEEAISITVVRRRITIENVTYTLVRNFDQNFAHIRVQSFMDDHLCKKIEAMLNRAENDDGAKGVILDFRGNQGGSVDQAVCMGRLFVGPQVIVKFRYLNEQRFENLMDNRSQVTRLPAVVLIDALSASASELVAGALQDYRRAWIVGEKSFGKGSVQRGQPLPFHPSLLSLKTIALFYQPSGRTNQMVGILPDFEAATKPDATEDERFFAREADLFPNAIGHDGPEWSQTRPADVARIENCASVGERALKRYAEMKSTSLIPVDYQLLRASEVLVCDGLTAPGPEVVEGPTITEAESSL